MFFECKCFMDHMCYGCRKEAQYEEAKLRAAKLEASPVPLPKLQYGHWIQLDDNGDMRATSFTGLPEFVIDTSAERNTIVVIKAGADRYICSLQQLIGKIEWIEGNGDYVREVFVAK